MRQVGILLLLLALAAGLGFSQSTIAISPCANINGTVGTAYLCTFATTGGTAPYTWFQISDGAGPLPPGLTFSNGTISGTPTTAGTYPNIQIAVDDQPQAQDTGYGTFTIVISPCVPTLTPATLPNAEVGINYSETFQVTGCTGTQYVFSTSGTLPSGLTLDPNTGLLSGQPVKAGTYTFNVEIFDAANGGPAIAQPSYTLIVAPPPMITTASPLPGGIVGQTYTPLQIAVTGGTPPYRYTIQGTPPGLILLSNGMLQGTPTTAGTFSFTITVTDSVNLSTPTTLQITFTAATPFLQVSPTGLTFSSLVGGNAPPPQAVSITPTSAASASPMYTVQIDGGQTGSAAPAWLTVTPTKGTAPAQLVVSANQGTLAAGSNPGRIRIFDSNNQESDVSVTLNVAAGSSQLQVAPNVLRFTARQQTPGVLQQDLLITNSGGGGPLGFSTSVVNGSSWITGITPGSGQTTPGTPVLLQVQVNTQGLQVGNYHDVIQVLSTSGNVSIPISLFVSEAGSIIGVNVTGFRFQARQAGGFSNSQTVEILNVGDPSETVNWTASLLMGSNWLSLGSSSGTATAMSPGLLTLTPNSSATTLSGPAYALVQLSDSHSLNSPQYIVAVLDLESSSTAALPDPSPAGLFFSGVASGSQPATQQITVNTSSATAVPFQAATSTTSGGTWLTVVPASGPASGTAPGKLTVSINTSGLAAGVYTGLVNISMSGALRSVNVTLVVEPGSGSSATSSETTVSEIAHTAAGCSPSKVVLTENGLVNNFSVPAGWPATLIAQLTDDCGSPLTTAAVVASFSNGDAPITLRGDGLGNYSASWQPSAVTSQTAITLTASSGSLTPATAQLIGGVTQNASSSQAPVLSPGGTLNNLNPVVGAPLAPGTVAQVYGSTLAAAAMTPSSIPLRSLVNGTQMLVGGLSAPLYYLSSEQLNVELPFELMPNQQYQVVVISNNAPTLPDTIDYVPQQPGVAATSDGHTIAQHNSNYALVSSSSPAQPGEYVIIYLAGMGATYPSVPSGAASPSAALANVTAQPTVTVGGQNAMVAFAGLTPGAVGLYQITFQVPQGLSAGDQNLVVTQGAVSANTTLLTIGQ